MDEEPNTRKDVLTEIALADGFVDRFGDSLRYVEDMGRWYHWQQHTWKECGLLPFTLAQRMCREVSKISARRKDAEKIGSARTRAAVVSLARERDGIRTTAPSWDSNPWLLGTPGGTLDLRTGSLSPGRREDLVSKRCAVCPDYTMPRPLWENFLAKVTCGDARLAEYLQTYAGYCLTGITTEQVLAFFYGDGQNGKSVFLNTISGVMGEYACSAPPSLFEEQPVRSHPTELARLRGARLVVAQEIERGKRWAEAIIKSLTGGDPITARFMRQDDFTFSPVLKLMLAGNHRPELASVGRATRRRYRLVPFRARISNPDKTLTDRLRAEWPAILHWAVEGCLRWQETGLSTPSAVESATDDYFQDSDAFGSWLAECVVKGRPAEHEESEVLRASWRAWAEKAGVRPGSQVTFAGEMESRGYVREYLRIGDRSADRKRWCYRGVRLIRQDYTGDPRYV